MSMKSTRSIPALTDVLRQHQPPDACWPWGGTVNYGGYGVITFNDTQYRAHRVVYELLVGPIPLGFTIDHVCHTEALARGECQPGACAHRACVNPAHLEAVTGAVNSLRGGGIGAINAAKDRCIHGHPLDKVRSARWRQCSACRQIEAASRRVGPLPPPTECKRGHPWTPENRYSWGGTSYCRVCHRELARSRRQQVEAA